MSKSKKKWSVLNKKYANSSKGINIFMVVWSAIGSFVGLFMVGFAVILSQSINALGGLDSFVSTMLNDGGNDTAILNEKLAQLGNNLGQSFTSQDFTTYYLSLAFVVFTIFALSLFIFSLVRLVFSAMSISRISKGIKIKNCFVMSIISACLSFFIFDIISVIVNIISAISLYKSCR